MFKPVNFSHDTQYQLKKQNRWEDPHKTAPMRIVDASAYYLNNEQSKSRH